MQGRDREGYRVRAIDMNARRFPDTSYQFTTHSVTASPDIVSQNRSIFTIDFEFTSKVGRPLITKAAILPDAMRLSYCLKKSS
ncbi:unnamed protein product [Oppiella nova]|uniref:Uncharacterized protein n=1 Tax=Oppiella nova TaxID=334625 RepID=A0A7R9L8F6_9ACAR|nr:unnamed protein product [Oppiella nova]CAG2159380.1 unnamed protein product [Oppiella nova]